MRSRALVVLLVVSLTATLQVTLTPTGSGWAWGSPVDELRWYLTGLDSNPTRVQLLGNLGLLATPAIAVVLLWPRAARRSMLMTLAVAAAALIELLQWTLPLGRVVSPMDAALNATGAVAAGALAATMHRAAEASRSPSRTPRAVASQPSGRWLPARSPASSSASAASRPRRPPNETGKR